MTLPTKENSCAEEGYKMCPNPIPYIVTTLYQVSGISRTLLLRWRVFLSFREGSARKS